MRRLPYEQKPEELIVGKNLILIWLIGTCSFALIGLFVLDVQKYYVLTARGVATKGKIVGLQPNNHRAVVYEYQTAEGDFSGAGHASD